MLERGTVLRERYRIDSTLGKGGQTRVYLAHDSAREGAAIVIKELVHRTRGEVERNDELYLFSKEAEILQRLENPHLPAVFEQFEENGTWFIAEQYIEGANLQELLDKGGGSIPERQVLAILRQSLEILDFLHTREPPVVVRDIKPSNILLDRDGTVYFVDFSIARTFEDGRGDTIRMGSTGYSPPEQYSGKSDPRSDLYSCAATMFHALTGFDPAKKPFCLPPPSQCRPGIHPHWDKVIPRALKLNAEERFQSAPAFSRALKPLACSLEKEMHAGLPARISAMLSRLFDQIRRWLRQAGGSR